MSRRVSIGRQRAVRLFADLAACATLFWSAGWAVANAGSAKCEPRSTTDPARLNIAVEADGHGLIPPCKAWLEFYIARNTPLRSLEPSIRITGDSGEAARIDRKWVELVRMDYGMYAQRIALDAGADVACRNVSVAVEMHACRGEGGGPIECPDIRVKAPDTLADLSVTGDGVGVCRDG